MNCPKHNVPMVELRWPGPRVFGLRTGAKYRCPRCNPTLRELQERLDAIEEKLARS